MLEEETEEMKPWGTNIQTTGTVPVTLLQFSQKWQHSNGSSAPRTDLLLEGSSPATLLILGLKEESQRPAHSLLKEACACILSHPNCVQLLATLWTVAQQAPLSMGFPRQECWNGFSCLSPGYLPNPGIEPKSVMFPALGGGFFTASAKC